ncbi:MAG: hypothetical protein ACWGO1_13665, partial [Anaerolineales bacterium]
MSAERLKPINIFLLVVSSVLICASLAACQPAPDPTRRPISGSATPVKTDGPESSRTTASPTARKPAATPTPTKLPES